MIIADSWHYKTNPWFNLPYFFAWFDYRVHQTLGLIQVSTYVRTKIQSIRGQELIY